jgi:hypothetical protein
MIMKSALFALAIAAACATLAAGPDEKAFIAFVDMMVPHHQGAVDMAKAVLRYGRNEQLRRMAQEIIVTQQQEIAAMRLAVGEQPKWQFSNTVSGTDPADNTLLGVIRLGDPNPGNLSPLYRGQLLVHGMGFAPDGRTIAVVSIGSNSVVQ